MYTTFIGVYRGRTVAEAELVCVTSEKRVVGQVMRALLGEEPEREGGAEAALRLLKYGPEDEGREG